MAVNDVFWDENGFLKILYRDARTYQVVKETSDVISGVIAKWRKENEKKGKEEKLLMLVHLSMKGKPDVRAMTEANERIEKYGYDRMAVYGVQGVFLRGVVNGVAKLASGKKEIRMFDTEEEAVAWLKTFKGKE